MGLRHKLGTLAAGAAKWLEEKAGPAGLRHKLGTLAAGSLDVSGRIAEATASRVVSVAGAVRTATIWTARGTLDVVTSDTAKYTGKLVAKATVTTFTVVVVTAAAGPIAGAVAAAVASGAMGAGHSGSDSNSPPVA